MAQYPGDLPRTRSNSRCTTPAQGASLATTERSTSPPLLSWACDDALAEDIDVGGSSWWDVCYLQAEDTSIGSPQDCSVNASPNLSNLTGGKLAPSSAQISPPLKTVFPVAGEFPVADELPSLSGSATATTRKPSAEPSDDDMGEINSAEHGIGSTEARAAASPSLRAALFALPRQRRALHVSKPDESSPSRVRSKQGSTLEVIEVWVISQFGPGQVDEARRPIVTSVRIPIRRWTPASMRDPRPQAALHHSAERRS